MLPVFNKIAILHTSILKTTRLFKILTQKVLGTDYYEAFEDSNSGITNKMDLILAKSRNIKKLSKSNLQKPNI